VVPERYQSQQWSIALWGLDCAFRSGINTSLVPTWSGTVLIDFWDYVTIYWLPGLEILQNRLCLFKSLMVHAWCVIFLKVSYWGIQLFDHCITLEISMYTWIFWTILILMHCLLLVFTQSATCSGNSPYAMSICSGCLMNFSSCFWNLFRTYWTGSLHTSKIETYMVNLTVNSHGSFGKQDCRISVNHSRDWRASPGEQMRPVKWAEHWHRTGLLCFSVPQIIDKFWQIQHLMI